MRQTSAAASRYSNSKWRLGTGELRASQTDIGLSYCHYSDSALITNFPLKLILNNSTGSY